MLSKRLPIIIHIITAGFLSLFVVMRLVSAETSTLQPTSDKSCFATHDDGLTVQNSADAGAIIEALELAEEGAIVKLAGTCSGVHTRIDPRQGIPMTQTVYIDKSITLQGGHTPDNWAIAPNTEQYPTVLDAGGDGRVISIPSIETALGDGRTVNIKHLEIVNGIAGIFSKDYGFTEGGGMAVGGNFFVSIQHTIFRNNQAGIGGGLSHFGQSLTIDNCTFISNSAEIGGGLHHQRTMTVTNSTFAYNSASSSGGAIDNVSNATIDSSTFLANSAGSGGAVEHTAGTMQISNSVFRQNTANLGGALLNLGKMSVDNSLIVENRAEEFGGGGIYTILTLTVTGSTIAENFSSSTGGGIMSRDGYSGYVASPETWIKNSTLSGNVAAAGGGIFNESTWLLLEHTTVVSNTAFTGAGIFSTKELFDDPNVTSTNLRSSLITNNIKGRDLDSLGEGANSFRSADYNVIGTLGDSVSLTGTSDSINVTSLQVAPLADNLLPTDSPSAGTTLTHALLADSLAIDHALIDGCPIVDQRGLVRPQGGVCDAGAFEVYQNRFKVFMPVAAFPAR